MSCEGKALPVLRKAWTFRQKMPGKESGEEKTSAVEEGCGRRRGTANAVDADEHELDERGTVFNVQPGGNSSSGIVNLVVGGVELANVTVDSGIVTNIVSATTWKALKAKEVSIRAEKKTTRKLYAYGSDTPLRTSGTFTLDICSPVNGKSARRTSLWWKEMAGLSWEKRTQRCSTCCVLALHQRTQSRMWTFDTDTHSSLPVLGS